MTGCVQAITESRNERGCYDKLVNERFTFMSFISICKKKFHFKGDSFGNSRKKS